MTLPVRRPVVCCLSLRLLLLCVDLRFFLGNTVTHQLLYISETPFVIISACVPCSLHIAKEGFREVRRLLASVITSRSPVTSTTFATPKVHSQEQLKRSKARDSDGFVQLHEINIAAPTSRLDTILQPNSTLDDGTMERKERYRSSLGSILSPDQVQFH